MPVRARPFVVIAVLVLLVSVVYGQVGGHPFVSLDDGEYVCANPVVLKGLTADGAAWAFTTNLSGHWHPLTWLSHMADVSLFGVDARAHHLENALFHCLNAILLFLALNAMTGAVWRSGFVAALFAVHPLHVESVAWAAERKDVLFAFFGLLALGAYVRYVRRPGPGRYLIVAALFVLGLLAKSMLVTLPFVLLLLDYWPLGRLAEAGDAGTARFPRETAGRLAREKVPLLFVSAAFGVATWLSMSLRGSVKSLETVSVAQRVANALVSYVLYLERAVVPASLAVVYPHPAGIGGGIPWWQAALAAILLAALSVAALRHRRRFPYLAVGWLWYLGTLVPVIGLLQAGEQAMADRYSYFPMIGIYVAVAWGAADLLAGRRSGRVALGVLGGAALSALAAAAWVQAGLWRDSVTLLTHTVGVTRDNWFAWNELGLARAQAGRLAEAADAFRESARINPKYAEAWNNLGNIEDDAGRHEIASAHYREALRLVPRYADAWYNLGIALGKLGRDAEAVEAFRSAVTFNPGRADAWYFLGLACASQGRFDGVLEAYRRLLRLDPGRAQRLMAAAGRSPLPQPPPSGGGPRAAPGHP